MKIIMPKKSSLAPKIIPVMIKNRLTTNKKIDVPQIANLVFFFISLQ